MSSDTPESLGTQWVTRGGPAPRDIEDAIEAGGGVPAEVSASWVARLTSSCRHDPSTHDCRGGVEGDLYPF